MTTNLGSSPSADTRQQPRKQRGIALVLEILPGLIGLLGFGWIYAGNTAVGVLCLVGYILWLLIAAVLSSLTAGFGCFFTLPVSLALLSLSAGFLAAYTRRHPELFSQ